MYASSYSKLVWGLVLVFVHFNIGPVDILPNFIGYIMVYYAVSSLAAQHETFNKAKLPALVMVFVSLKDIIKLQNPNTPNASIQSANIYLVLLQQVPALIIMYLMYSICRGIYLAAEERGLNELRDSAKGRWQFYLIVSIVMLFLQPFLFNLPEDWTAVIFVGGIISLIAVLFIILLANKAKNQMAD